MNEHEKLIHGKEFDEAIDRCLGPEGLRMVICESALDARVKALVDQQLDDLEDEKVIARCREELEAQGAEVPEGVAELLNLRSTIAGSFTYGLAIGIEIGHMRVESGAE